MKKSLLLLLIFLCSFPVLSESAIVPDSSGASRPVFFSRFTKQSITWNWLSRFSMSDSAGKHWRWTVRDIFRSNLINPGGSAGQWKDEHQFSGQFFYTTSVISPALYFKSWLKSDRQPGSANLFSNHAAGILFHTKYITPYIGYQQARNKDLSEWGWDTGFEGRLLNFKAGAYNTNMNFDSHYDFYEKRKNYEHNLGVSVQTKFSRFSGDSLSFVYGGLSRQYFVGGKLEHVTLFNRSWKNHLYYYLTYRDRITLQTLVQSRDISYFNGRNIFNIENRLRYRHSGQKVFLGISLRTNDETQDNFGIRTDSRQRQTAMRLELGYKLTEDQSVDLNAAYVKLQYDTPDKIYNNDDRDEQRFVFNLKYRYRFSPLLNMDILAYSYLFHQIYIFSEQSINNSWNRIFKLNPQVNYFSDRIRNRLSTEVMANYTIYDYEGLITNTRSFVFRRYTFSDSASVRLFGSQYAGASAKIQIEDKGSFFEKIFKQQLLQSNKSELYSVFLSNENLFYFRCQAGFTFYSRKEWRYIPIKKRSRTITNRGPFFNISYKASQKIIFSANVSLSYLKDSSYHDYRYTTGYIRLHYLL